jgi:hypothetical protein
LAFSLDDQAITVVLDFMDPIRPVGNRGRAGRQAKGAKGDFIVAR